MEKDALIQEKEKLYVQLKNIIARPSCRAFGALKGRKWPGFELVSKRFERQPGPEVAEQLAWYSQNLKEKTGHMKQMAAELETYHNQAWMESKWGRNGVAVSVLRGF